MRGTALVLAVGLLPAALGAQGFGVYELSTCTMARGGAVAANPCGDGSAIFFNPAGVSALTGTHVSLGLTTITPSGGFTDDIFQQHTDMSSQTFLVPNVFVTRRMNDKLGLGIGLFVPYGLGTKWPLTFAGRFDGYDTEVKTFYIQPTASYQITPKLSLGLGVAYVHASVALHQRLDLSTFEAAPGVTLGQLGIPTGTEFGNADLTASGNGIAFNGGIIYKVTDQLSLGGHFMTKKTVHFTGTAAFKQLPTGLTLPAGNPITQGPPLNVDGFLQATVFNSTGPLAGGDAQTDVTLPDQWSLGLDYKFSEKWHVSADYQQVVWGWFNTLVVSYTANPTTPLLSANERYRDSNGIRIGTEFQYSPNLTLRAGYIYNSAAAPDETVTPRLPEGPRNSFIVGAGLNLTSSLRGDASFMYLKQNDRRGRVSDVNTLNTGLYTFSAVLLGAGLSYTF
ncbi:MAG TPA: outer membrane protein transport protein [Gemmatimonadales bacterium]|nr:outer membrane protein transport protein [Gemmatimonadales bacterium]